MCWAHVQTQQQVEEGMCGAVGSAAAYDRGVTSVEGGCLLPNRYSPPTPGADVNELSLGMGWFRCCTSAVVYHGFHFIAGVKS